MNLAKRILYIIIVLFLFFSLTKNLFDYGNTVQFYEGYKKDFEEQKKKNLILKTQILKSKDPNELEKTIRNKLNLTKEGETAIIVPEPTKIVAVPRPTPIPFYLQWWNFIIGK